MPRVAELRQRVVAEAEGWIGTPYHHMGRVKGAGVDCLTLLAEVYERAGIVGHVEVPFYRPDFFAHGDEERYLAGLLGHGHEVAAPLPGDVALFRYERVFGHSAIVVEWPRLIHAINRRRPPRGVQMVDATQGLLRGRQVKFISPF